jgi:hypothetical protein
VPTRGWTPQVPGDTTAGQPPPEVEPIPQIEIHDDYTGWSRLETNARGVRIKNSWSRYDIPWAAIRDIAIVEAMWRGSGSPYGYELMFTVARDTDPGQPTTARHEGSGPNTVDPGRFEFIKAHATKTKTGSSILPKSIQPDRNLEELRTASWPRAMRHSQISPARVMQWKWAVRPGSSGTSRTPARP